MPSAMPLVSILIRSMDRASLSEALASVAAQTYPSIEVVLINAKGDGHREVGQWCGRFPIHFVGASGGLGRSDAANVGLVESHGAYLMFLDDDDLIDPDHIESLVSALGQSQNCRAAFSGTRVTDAAGTTLGVYDHAFSAAQLLVGNFLPIHAVLFSRELVTAGCRFDPTLETYEDWDFWLQISRHTDFVQTGKVSAVYRSFLGDSGMSQAEHRPLQRQRRSVVWRKWWPHWRVENVDLLASDLEKTQDERDQQNTALSTERYLQIDRSIQLSRDLDALQVSFNEQASHLSHLSQTIAELQASLADRKNILVNREAQITILNARIHEMLSSSSWRLSAPIRHAGRWANAVRRRVGLLRLLAKSTWQFLRRDSIAKQSQDAYRFVRLEGWTGVKQLLTRKASSQPSSAMSPPHQPTTGSLASGMERPERRDFQPLASIDVDRYAYFFFDVFDTAIVRLFEKPVDVFKYIEFATQSVDFEVRRVQQERDARKANRARKDIQLPDIYKNFNDADINCEIDTELKFCVAQPEVLAFYTDLVSKGKKIYFVSDMYLSRETVEGILRRNGFTRFEDVFVSSEDDLIKGDGSRFTWLKAALPDSVGSAIHIGDNHVSDWVQPRQHGYDAFQYKESIEFYRHDSFLFSKSSYLIDQNSLGISFNLGMFKHWKSGFLDKEPGYWRQFGFFYGGALVAAFSGFIQNRISQAKLSTSRVFFLARDGDIMSKVSQLLYPEYEAVYLLASRRCMSFPSLDTLHSIDGGNTLKLFTTPIGVTCANDLMERFGYDDLHDLRSAFNDLDSQGLLHSESAIWKCVVDNEDSILTKAKAERDTLLLYLDAMHFFDDQDIVIADVGWGGSIQNALVKLLGLSGRNDQKLHGMYLGVADQVAHAHFKTGYLFQGDKSQFGDFLNLMELITSSPKDGVVRVAKVDGRYEPVNTTAHAEELNRQAIAADIQTGILEFTQIVKNRKIDNLDFFQPSDFQALFSALQHYPSQEDVEQLGGVKHAMTLGNHFGDPVLSKKG